MNWDAISATAEVLGALAVIVTLIYLAVQLRQQNTVTKAQIEQQRADSVIQLVGVLSATENRALYTQVVMDSSLTSADLSEEENVHLRIIVSPIRANFENTYRQFQSGYISKEFYDEVSKQLYLIHGPLILRFNMPLTTGFRAELVRIIENGVSK
ncbi:hypothetical protein R0135_11055 [Congregibacter variabilis]|uniref:Uncharacterized protein n=1 Tax=Congregibacter variabilis TaxID=3081200 RepID=A0ABZ0I0K3_9GAMM|nr:hypothetical protein R0135_11055 [Congregibacter sp. IMCC43200]